MQHIDADICFVLNGVGLPLSAKALGMIETADTIAGRGIDVASICKDLDALLSRDFPRGYTNEAFVLLTIDARNELMHTVHRAALAGLRQHSIAR